MHILMITFFTCSVAFNFLIDGMNPLTTVPISTEPLNFNTLKWEKDADDFLTVTPSENQKDCFKLFCTAMLMQTITFDQTFAQENTKILLLYNIIPELSKKMQPVSDPEFLCTINKQNKEQQKISIIIENYFCFIKYPCNNAINISTYINKFFSTQKDFYCYYQKEKSEPLHIKGSYINDPYKKKFMFFDADKKEEITLNNFPDRLETMLSDQKILTIPHQLILYDVNKILKMKFNAQRITLANTKKAHTTLTEKYKDLNDEYLKIFQKNNQLTDENVNLQSEYETCKNLFAEQENNSMSSLEENKATIISLKTTIERSNEQIKSFNDIIDTQKAKIASLEQENKNFQSSFQTLQSDINKQKSTLNNLEKEKETATNRNLELQKQLDELKNKSLFKKPVLYSVFVNIMLIYLVMKHTQLKTLLPF